MKWAAGTHKAAVSPTVSAAATIAPRDEAPPAFRVYGPAEDRVGQSEQRDVQHGLGCSGEDRQREGEPEENGPSPSPVNGDSPQREEHPGQGGEAFGHVGVHRSLGSDRAPESEDRGP